MSGLARKDPQQQRPLKGCEKGLLFLVSLDEGIATRILAHLSPDEVKALRGAAEGLTEVHPRAIASVHREFAEYVENGLPTSLKGSGAYLRRLVGQALGEGKAAELWSENVDQAGAVQQLAKLDVPSVLALIEREHPQTIAVILSQFSPGRAAEIVKEMGPERQAEVMIRLAQLQGVPRSVMQEIEQQFAIELESMGDGEREEIDGVKVAINVLKRMEGERSEALIEELATLDNTLADELRKSMFTFDDLMRIDTRGMQAVLKEVSTETLVVALKTASDELREKVFGAVSKRAAAMLREELELLGPMRVSDVEQAQQQIVEQALNLERDGRITIAEEGGGDYV
ncbi:MAG: flagellar motor switch protein FliG [Myxococcales bacterium]|nr:flagellar motor switch protein FliG [Myxococcales bacterium]